MIGIVSNVINMFTVLRKRLNGSSLPIRYIFERETSAVDSHEDPRIAKDVFCTNSLMS